MKGHRGRQALVVLTVGVTLLAAPGAAAAAGPPEIDASWVTDVTATSANLRAEINANGLSTTYRFEYITEAAYEANLNAIPPREGFFGAAKSPPSGSALLGSATTPLAVVRHVGSLTPVTTYRYRAVATNSAPDGTVTSPEHALTTQETGLVFRLPDNRGWEMVSPGDKGGGAIAAPGSLFGGGTLQAALGGGGVTYGSASAFDAPPGAPPGSQYVSRRSGSGWSTENVSAPLDSADYGDEPDGVPYRVFASDLSRGLLFGGLACRGDLPGCPAPNAVLPGSGAPAGHMAYYLRSSAGAFSSLLDSADLAHSAVAPEHFAISFVAASPDLAHVVLSSCAKLTANATEVIAGPGECDPAAQNLYKWSGGALSLLNLKPGDVTGTPGAAIAAPLGAISDDGARVYWRETASGNLYLREGAQTFAVDEPGGASFQTATPDGSVAFFTEGEHLHRFLAASKATTDLTPAGGVVGMLGASADGAYAYYQDATGLQQWHSGATTTVAPGAAAMPSSYPPSTGTARVSAAGARLAFLSDIELTGYDNADANTGEPNAELYLYGPPLGGGASELICASCNPTGERSQGSASIPGGQVNGSTVAYKSRALSAAGTRLFFDSSDSLVVQDTNSRPDVYQWEAQGAGDCNRSPGCVNLISSGRGNGGARFIDASADGDDAFFITDEALVSTDPGSIDLYDARVGGGFPVPPTPIPCIGDACQALPSPPDDPTPGTLTKNAGNPPLRYFKQKKAGCSKGRVMHKGRCRSERALARRACRRKRGMAKRQCLREANRTKRTVGRGRR